MEPRIQAADNRQKNISIFLLYALVIIFSFCFQIIFIPYHDILPDEGFLAYSGHRISEGQLPHRDFVTSYVGGLFFFFNWLFRIFGSELLVLRYSLVPVGVLHAAFCFYYTRYFLNTKYAFIGLVLANIFSPILYPYPFPTWYIIFLSYISLGISLRFNKKADRKLNFIQGVLIGLCCLIKQTGGAFLFFAVMVSRILFSSQPGITPRIKRGFLLLIIIFNLLLTHHHLDLKVFIFIICPLIPVFLILKNPSSKVQNNQNKTGLQMFWKDMIHIIVGGLTVTVPYFIYFSTEDALTIMVKGILTISLRIIHSYYLGIVLLDLQDLILIVPASVFLVISIKLAIAKRENLHTVIFILLLSPLIISLISWINNPHPQFFSELGFHAQKIILYIPISLVILYTLYIFNSNSESREEGNCSSPPEPQKIHLFYVYLAQLSMLLYPIYFSSYIIQLTCMLLPLFLYLLVHFADTVLSGSTPVLRISGKISLISVPLIVGVLFFGSVLNLIFDVETFIATGEMIKSTRQPCVIKSITGIRLQQSDRDNLTALSRYIAFNSDPDEKIFVFCDSLELYLITGRKSPTKYDYYSTQFVSPEESLQVIKDLKQSDVRFVITSPTSGVNKLLRLQNYIAENYQVESSFGIFTVFKRRE